MEEAELSGDALAGVFARLKLFSIDLLDLLRNPSKRKTASFLPEMAAFLRRSPAAALQPCFDYTLFPLLMLLDAAVQCRKEKGLDSREGFGAFEVSDSVAEGVLTCLEELLKKCHLGSVDQMATILKKLTFGAMLSPSEASEELRIGIIRCFRTMLLHLLPCSVKSCLCKQAVTLPTTVSIPSLEVDHMVSSRQCAQTKECLLVFLRSQNASAAVGHWLSLLLQTAELEASRGHRGSADLRKEAFLALRVLVAKVGSADALAFFLPGIVSRFAKALHISKSMSSGAAGSALSIEQAILGLTESLMIVLNDKDNSSAIGNSADDFASVYTGDNKSTEGVLEVLRRLPANIKNQNKTIDGHKEKNSYPVGDTKLLHVKRTKEWIEETAVNVDKLLSATFQHLCVHPSERVRKALVDGIRGLLTTCNYTLRRSKLLLLECLCALVCDDAVTVSEAAQESLESLFMQGETFLTENEISDIFTRLLEKLPRMVLGSEEKAALSHARKILALLFYAGPEIVANCILRFSVNGVDLFDSLGLSLGQSSQFSGSVNKLLLSKPLSVGYLFTVAELKSIAQYGEASHGFDAAPFGTSNISAVQNKDWQNGVNAPGDYELPHVPPWFVHVESQKLYLTLAGILRLVGLSAVAWIPSNQAGTSLSILIDILLDRYRKLIVELRGKDFNNEGLRSWYMCSGSGQLLRQASAAVIMLNEVIYGLSYQSLNMHLELFSKARVKVGTEQSGDFMDNDQSIEFDYPRSVWRVRDGRDTRNDIIHCIGSILHEYMAPEVWDLPADLDSPAIELRTDADLPSNIFRDITALHQMIIEGIGIFGMVLGEDFARSGFMQSSLYLLLRKINCSNIQIRTASDAALKALATATGYATVGHFIVANADYVVDSLCRQLRHLDINPHIPDVLASLLSYIGVACDILPLLEEPMRAVSVELEILGRYEHPHLTVPFLKAVGEIAKALKFEACELPNKAKTFDVKVSAMVNDIQDIMEDSKNTAMPVKVDHLHIEYWEELLCNLNEMRRYRRTVGSLAGSCLIAAIPLVSSLKEAACLIALDIVENVSISISKVEQAYKHEKQTKAAIEKAILLLSLNDLGDDMDTADDETDENRLLPAMNKLWPYLVICLTNMISVAVVTKCTRVLSRAVEISGGDFFSRRFRNDGPAIWRLLTLLPFQRKPMPSKNEKAILLPYRSNSTSSEEPMAEISSRKIQIAVLDMIAEMALSKSSSPALEHVLKKVSGLVVGIAFSGMTELREAAVKALAGLACMDPDLIWILLADVWYSLNRGNIPQPPSQELPEISELIPPPYSSKEYLYVQYGGVSFGSDIDPSSVENVFRRIQSIITCAYI